MRALALLAVPAFVSLLVIACGSDATSGSSTDATTPAIPVTSPSTSSSGTTTTTPATTQTAITAATPDAGTVDADVPDTYVAPPDINLTTVTMQYNGQTRAYFLGLPSNYDASKSYPMVMLFHGNPGTKEQMRSLIQFEQVSHKDAILVYPDGLQGAWDLYTPTATNLDMNWINALPATIASSYHVDLKHVYGFGFSGGSFMMAEMACRFGTTVFRAVAINSGGGPQESTMGYPQRADGCYICPGGPVPSFIVHGDADPVVDPSSGKFTARCIGETNGCTATASGDPEDAISPSPCAKGDGCSAPETWCYIPGLGHAPWDQAMSAEWAFFQAAP